MAFNIRRIAAVRDALAVAMDNLKRYPWMELKLNSQFIYLPEAEQDIIAAAMRSRMDDSAALAILAIFERSACKQAELVA